MSIHVTGTAQKRAWADKVMPPVERVREHVWSVPVDFHGSPVRYTSCYLVTNDAGHCVVIDPGWDSRHGWGQFTDGLATAGIALSSVVGVVSTHLHPDHLGMVKRLVDETGAWFGMHPADAEVLDGGFDAVDEARATDRAWLDSFGVPDSWLDALTAQSAIVELLSNLARPTVLLNDGDELQLPGRRLRVIATPGHTAGHICLVDDDSEVIFTGDHVLPRITPNVGLSSLDTGRNPLREYFSSLEPMPLWDGFEVCPAHEYRFTGLAERAEQLALHHEERAGEILAVLAGRDATVWQIAENISWSRGWSSLDGLNLRSALAETGAHVEYLAGTGKVDWTAANGSPRVARLL
ncbi:MBL fold metallo-hydrolase [Spelaeicoccus albus]|uniref:Glyoxylase-like metal-dependent hydrolase (Beta-lactamase superfamily II) n=1 Tax=Spelaeicoccus albus TaxID=1280376 RepID=A0A7Z0AD62_9MICO|nr:MBL fold metallo-hydrolase [Spelaeicoccus albus]NYI67266.1 glyoxylase-like metal-dependent hydrolase (beta-lactamase superfamily II) [Spelaeicoccus albus]